MLQCGSASKLIGKHIWTEFPEGIDQPFHEAYHKAYETQQPIIFEDYYPPWDQWYENRIYPSKDGLTIYFTNITQRKQAETTIQRINRALQVLSKCSETVMKTTDSQELLNELCLIIHREGLYPMVWLAKAEDDEIKSLSVLAYQGYKPEFFEPLQLSWDSESINYCAAGESRNKQTHVIMRKSDSNISDPCWDLAGSKTDIEAAISLPIMVNDKESYVLNIYSNLENSFDEEEIKLLEKLANNLTFGLNAIYNNQEKEQLQRKLHQSQKMETIGQLTGGIAHDFNNILACIIGYSDLALDKYSQTLDAQLLKYIELISKAAGQAENLISQMLIFSRNSPVEARVISPVSTTIETIKLLESTLPSSIQISLDVQTDIPNIHIDPINLHQIIMNICINARDAINGKGKINVTINTLSSNNLECDSCHEKITGNFVILKISDNGPGIEQEVIDRIFDPFFTTKEVGKGTGMGLSVVHGILHEHGGHIIIDTDANTGSSFKLLFPVCNKQINSNSSKKIPEFNNVDNQHILVVDDNESIALLLDETLESAGYQTSMFTSSQEALKAFEKQPDLYDLVITDQTMPDLTGKELAARLLSIKTDLPIILCSGYSDLADENKVAELGIKQFLQKPVNSHQLLEAVSSLLM